MTSISSRISYLIDGRILGLAAFLTLPIAIFAPKGLAILFTLAAVASLIAGLARRQKNLFMAGWDLRLAIAFSLWSLASAVWSITPEVSMKGALVFSAVTFGGLILIFMARRLEGKAKDILETGLIAGGILGFAIIGIEVVFGSPINAILWMALGRPPQPPTVLILIINQGAAVAAIFLLPWILAIKKRIGPLWAAGAFAFGVTVLAFCQADSQKVALFIGIVATLIVLVGGSRALKGFSLLFVVFILSAPWVVATLPDPLQVNNSAAFLPKSAQHRLLIWETTAGHIFERPILGAGFDTARAFYGDDQKVINYFGGKDSDIGWANNFEPIPLHPHNGFLQVWLELGAVGAILLAAGLFYIFYRIAAVENNFRRSMIFGSFVTGLVIFAISYGAWQAWWMSAIWLVMAFGAAAFNVADDNTLSGRDQEGEEP